MMKQEFEELAKVEVTQEQYDKIEMIYTHHPLMGPDSQAKAQIIKFYKAGLIPDLYPRAREIMILEKYSYEAGKEDRLAHDVMISKIREAEDEYENEHKAFLVKTNFTKAKIAHLQEVRI